MSRILAEVDDKTLARAKQYAGTDDTDLMIQIALDYYVSDHAQENLGNLGGSLPDIRVAFEAFKKRNQ